MGTPELEFSNITPHALKFANILLKKLIGETT